MLSTVNSIQSYLEPIVQIANPKYKSRFRTAKLIEIREEGEQTYTLLLKPSKPRAFKFYPGQHVTLFVDLNGTTYQRTFSISSSPQLIETNGFIEVSIKRQPHGLITPWLPDNLKAGDKVYLSVPQGQFTLRQLCQDQHQMMITAGSGITPVLSMLESLDSHALKRTKLLHYTRDKSDCAFSYRLQLLALNGLQLYLFETKTQGRISNAHLNAALKQDVIPSSVYVCGPNGFLNTARRLVSSKAEQLGINDVDIYTEAFGSIKAEQTNNVAINWHTNHNTTITSTQTSGDSLLDQAEKAGLKPMYGCRSGICRQCTATKTSGKVRNILTGHVSQAGKEEIQLCICVAETSTDINIKERTSQ